MEEKKAEATPEVKSTDDKKDDQEKDASDVSDIDESLFLATEDDSTQLKLIKQKLAKMHQKLQKKEKKLASIPHPNELKTIQSMIFDEKEKI